MKHLVVGAGAVGGIASARLVQAGHAVTVVARGAHLDAIRSRGLTVHSPRGTDVVRMAATDHPVVDAETIVLSCVKTQDVPTALRELALVAPASTPIVCVTNGIEAERLALRWFDRVYACSVYMPATFLEPGVVEAWGTPFDGLFDIGCYPHGSDELCRALSAAFDLAARVSA